MKFTLSNTEINALVSKVGRILSKKATIPILSGVLVDAKNDCLMFTASDNSESIIHRITSNDEMEILTEGKYVFSKETFDVAKKLKGKVTFEVIDNIVKVSQDKTVLEFQISDASQYPKIEVNTHSKPLILKGATFESIVHQTTFAASASDTRPILQGVNMMFNSDSSLFVSTDSHRLSRFTLNQKYEMEKQLSLTVPAGILDQATKIFDLKNDVLVFPSDNAIAFANGNTILFSRLIEGVYPDVSRLIPNDFEAELIVNRKELMDGLELLQAISTNSVVNLQVDSLFVKVSASGTGTKGIKELAFEKYEGEDGFSISFSAQYVLDALKRFDDSSISIRFTGRMKPFVIIPINAEDDYNALQLVLPVRQYE